MARASEFKNTKAPVSKYKTEGCGRFVEEPQYYKLLAAVGASVHGSNHNMDIESF
jgi:hypothetical protein